MDEVLVVRGPAPFDIGEIARRIAPPLRRHGVTGAYLFGSYARGAADAWSDVDLVVVMATDLPFIDRPRALTDVLDALPVATDLLVYTPEEFERGMKDGMGVFDALQRESVRLI